MSRDFVRMTGRPETLRTAREEAVYDALDRLAIPFSRVDHPAADSITACRQIEPVLGTPICKNLFLCNRQKTRFYLLAMHGQTPFRTAEVSRLLGCARLSFAPPEALEALLGVSPGSVSVMGLLHDTAQRVCLLMDRRVAQAPFFGCHPCVNTTTLRIRTEDLFERFLPFTGHEAILLDIVGKKEEESG